MGPVWPRVVGGFMSAEVSALITAYRIYWNKGHSDATIAPQKFDEDKFNKKRQVGRRKFGDMLPHKIIPTKEAEDWGLHGGRRF